MIFQLLLAACSAEELGAREDESQSEATEETVQTLDNEPCAFTIDTLYGEIVADNTMTFAFDESVAPIVRREQGATFARVLMSADDVGCKNVSVWYLTFVFKATDGARSDWFHRSFLRTVTIVQTDTGEEIAAWYEEYGSEGSTSGRITFEGREWHLPAGATVAFDLIGDLTAAQTGDTIVTSTDEDSASWATTGVVVWDERVPVQLSPTLTIE